MELEFVGDLGGIVMSRVGGGTYGEEECDEEETGEEELADGWHGSLEVIERC